MVNSTVKIIQALLYIASHQKDKCVDFMKAYKLLWLADRCHLRMHGRTITNDKYYAMPYGIVPTDAKHLLEGEATNLTTPEDYLERRIKIVSKHKYEAVAEPDLKEFSKSDIDVLNKVLENYNGLKPMELSLLSHKYPEWKQYEKMLNNENEKNSFPVNMDLFFENSDEDEADIFDQSSEMLEMTKEIYHEYN